MVFRRGYIVAIVAMVVAALLGGSRAVAQEYYYALPSAEQEQGGVTMEWGAGLGGVYTGISRISSPEVALNSRLGFTAHLDMGVVFGEYFALESEIAIQKVGFDAQYRGQSYDVRSTTLMVPVMLSLRLFDSMLRVNAGVALGVMSSGGYMDGRENIMFGAINPTWNITAGVGCYVLRKVLVELRVTQAVQDSLNQIGGVAHRAGVDFTSRIHQVSLGATVLF